MSPRPASRALPVAALALGALLTAGACRAGRDAAHEERAREEQEVRRLAEQAGRMTRDAQAEGDTGTQVSFGSDAGGRLARGADPPLGAGDVRVTSTDGALVLSLIGDTVRTRLGDSVFAKVQREMTADTSRGAGALGGFVARTVQGAVNGAMQAAAGLSLRVPVAEVRAASFADGELHLRTGSSNSVKGRFTPDDAERFLAALRARQQQPSGR